MYYDFMETRTALLYGQSMLLSLVANSLERSTRLHVIHASTWREIKAHLAKSDPHVLIFDLVDACQKRVLPLLVRFPHLLLIGLDVERNHAVVLSGRESNTLTMNQILEIVEERKAQTERKLK
jgi:hypothetical protein